LTQLAQRRADIQGLRALAVSLVVAGHVAPKTISGGFIGVDIFFVISGYVITLQMLRLPAEKKGAFLLQFYSRRILRIIPSALLVIAATILATDYYLGLVKGNEVRLDAGWASIFLSNFHFHNLSLDYFAAGIERSPLQHFWSLSIEEQFYLCWPVLFLLFATKNGSQVARRIFLALLALISLSLALIQSEVSQSPIFFLTHVRLWELAVGALIAFLPESKRFFKYFQALALCYLLSAACFIDESMQWPGAAAVPVICATALYLYSSQSNRLNPLNLKIFSYIGDLSYVIYLWHWPILTIFIAISTDFGTFEIVQVLALTLLFSLLTHHLFEKPIRFASTLRSRPVFTVSIGLASISMTSLVLFSSHQI
jgi:peptidoglycan/LPS O-acetylase OafA/YrhL